MGMISNLPPITAADATSKQRSAKAVLFGKIAAVAAAVSRIPKNGENQFFRYRYATESDITDGLRDLLNANGLAFLPPSVISWERDETTDNPKLGPRTRVQIQFALGCADTGETFTTILWGEANDTADKGFYKAYTGAVKYYLMKTFLIATGDDPEQDHQERPAIERQSAPRQQEQPHTNGSTLGKASEKQIKMLFAIWKKSGFDGDLKTWVKQNYACAIDDLTAKQASEAISTLQPEETPA